MSDATTYEPSEEHLARQAAAARRGVLAKSDVFSATQLWSLEFAQRSRRWLQNFDRYGEAEKRIASALLDGFLYFSDAHANELMLAGFHALSAEVVRGARGAEARQLWAGFFDTVIVTYVEGEVRNATDSGLEAARKFRKRAPFPQDRIMPPHEALARLVTGKARTVVFVDDFMGSGNQFVSTWTQPRTYQGGQLLHSYTFADVVAKLPDVVACYCPSITTAFALDRIGRECPNVTVSPGAILDARYDVMHPQSLVWPQALRADGQAFVRSVSDELGLPDTAGAEDDWRGFQQLGLALAIRDSIPDATLRMFRFKDRGWAPLVKEA